MNRNIIALVIKAMVLSVFVAALPANAQQPLGNPPVFAVSQIEEAMLTTMRNEKIPVSIYLVNGIKLQGQVSDFDGRVIVLKNSVSQMVYINAISTVIPSRDVTLP